MANINARRGGAIARANGALFEQLIDRACLAYADGDAALIQKTPEPMKPLRPPNRLGQFLACYTKRAQPDYKGTMRGGKTVVFEAKHTDSTRIERSRVTEEQLQQLLQYDRLGAACFVLVSFKFDRYYRVPVLEWDGMELIYGKKSVNEKDLAPFLLKGGVFGFLGRTASGDSLL